VRHRPSRGPTRHSRPSRGLCTQTEPPVRPVPWTSPVGPGVARPVRLRRTGLRGLRPAGRAARPPCRRRCRTPSGTSTWCPRPCPRGPGVNQEGEEQSFRCLANTGPRRFLVIENDAATKEEQAKILSHLPGSSRWPWWWTPPASRSMAGSGRRASRKPPCACSWSTPCISGPTRIPGSVASGSGCPAAPDTATRSRPKRNRSCTFIPHIIAEVSHDYVRTRRTIPS
jgi:hypothetical protein